MSLGLDGWLPGHLGATTQHHCTSHQDGGRGDAATGAGHKAHGDSRQPTAWLCCSAAHATRRSRGGRQATKGPRRSAGRQNGVPPHRAANGSQLGAWALGDGRWAAAVGKSTVRMALAGGSQADLGSQQNKRVPLSLMGHMGRARHGRK
jgi:hypothetical protein